MITMSFTYDALGNVLTKQTANLAKEGKFITYDYDYQRKTGGLTAAKKG